MIQIKKRGKFTKRKFQNNGKNIELFVNNTFFKFFKILVENMKIFQVRSILFLYF